MPTCYQLVGIPGSGKTTWYQNQEWMQDFAYISTDTFIEKFAESTKKSYSDVFQQYMPAAVNLMAQKVIEARTNNKDIIWDQTSTTFESRQKKFKMLPNYNHIAVVFKMPNLSELNRRLNSRPGKHIPDNVVKQMIENFFPPTIEEGFQEIWYAE